jgi:flagellar biosynthetic protein FliR
LQLPLFSVIEVQTFLICAARVGTLIGVLPVFYGGQTPAKVRVGLALAFSLMIFPVVSPFITTHILGLWQLLLLLSQEIVLGLAVGFVARLVFTAVEFSGTIVGFQMGYAAANVFDPQNQHQISLLGQFQNIIAILIFLALNIHYLFLRAIVYSYKILPPGKLVFSGAAETFLMHLAGDMFVLCIKFSAPILAVLLLSSLVLGLMARVFPQLNVFLLSYPLHIGLAFLIVGATMDVTVALMGRDLHAMGGQILDLLRLL